MSKGAFLEAKRRHLDGLILNELVSRFGMSNEVARGLLDSLTEKQVLRLLEPPEPARCYACGRSCACGASEG